MKRKRLIASALLLLLSMLLPLLVSCGSETNEDAGKATMLTVPFIVTMDKQPFAVVSANGTPDGDEVVVYTYEYQKDGVPSVLVHGEEGRSFVSLRMEMVNGVQRYSIFEFGNDAEKDYPIARNGFTLSIPTKLLSNRRIRVGQLVTIKNLDGQAGELENLTVGCFYPSGDYLSALTRRITLRDPVAGIKKDGIYFLSASYATEEKSLPGTSVIAVLEEKRSGRFKVTSLTESDHTVAGAPQMVFVGAYECAYANAFLKEDVDLNTSDLELVSSYSDSPAVIVDGELCAIKEENTEAITEAGIYLFNTDSELLLSAPSEVDRRDVVIVNDVVTFIGEENSRVMLPTAGGVVVTFAGKYKSTADKLTLGQPVETVLIDTLQIDGKYVRIGKQLFAVDLINRIRQPEKITVVYTPEFGETTGTNPYGTEIAISGGQVTAIEVGVGNMAIPEDGFVLSIHKDADNISLCADVSVGESAVSYLSGNNYGLHTLKVTGTDTVRSENALILYQKGPRTGTNVYGYEILVDAEGNAVGESHVGNSVIPKDGFVLSGHGVNKEALESAYVYGAKVLLDTETMTVSILSSPSTELASAAHRIEELQATLDDAKQSLADLDYETIDPMLETLSADLESAKSTLFTDNCADALAAMDRVSAAIEQLSYMMIETNAVENRSVWYRSTEKSDEEVRATVEKMKMLHVNSVYLESWYNGRFTGFSDNPLILHTTANGDYDVLEGFVRICHENGIEVHAWVENFFIGTVEAQEQANTKLAEHFEGRWLTDVKGKNTFFYSASNTNFIFMNPNDPEVRQFLLDFYQELVTKYDVDGIHLDYIRFPELNYGTDDFGYNEDIISAWQAKENTTVDPHTLKAGALYQSWIAFRQEIISSFVGSVHRMLMRTRPDVWLSAAVYPGLPTIKNQIFQDCATWVERGYMDELFSMTYGADNAYVESNAKMFAKLTGENCFYSTGLSAFGDTDEDSFAKQLAIVTDAGADGVAIFSLANITPSNYQYQITAGAFRGISTQANALGKTVAAGVRDYLRKAESLYVNYAGLSENDLSELRAVLVPLLYKADAFDPDGTLSFADRIRFCDQNIDTLTTLIETASGYFEEGKSAAATADLSRLVSILRTSRARLTERNTFFS